MTSKITYDPDLEAYGPGFTEFLGDYINTGQAFKIGKHNFFNVQEF